MGRVGEGEGKESKEFIWKNKTKILKIKFMDILINFHIIIKKIILEFQFTILDNTLYCSLRDPIKFTNKHYFQGKWFN